VLHRLRPLLGRELFAPDLKNWRFGRPRQG